ncbi:MAG: hypothetical protein HUJ61_05385, partial [Bacilli bacterium]|nr:hypothetical protein [Bacilli bacterium]
MKDVMIRFLSKIGIEDYERYDMDFEKAQKNPSTGIIDMIVVKKTPWDLDLLSEFMDGLNTLDFKYSLHFKYEILPSIEDTIPLFKDWHRYHFRFPAKITPIIKNKSICFIFESEEDEKKYRTTLKDFKELLRFLAYKFIVTTEIQSTL